MINLIYNETRKLLSRRKTLIIFVGILLLVGFIMFGEYKNDQMRKKYSSPEFRIQNMEQTIQSLKQIKDNPKISEEDKKQIESDIEKNENQLKELKANPNVQKTDWKKELNQRIKDEENVLKEPYMRDSDKERIKLEIDRYKYLLDYNIKYDENTLNAFNFLKTLFEILGAIFLAVGVMMFTGDMVSGEYTPPTMKFLITQPVSRGKVLFSKFISVVLASVIIILSVELIAYVIIGLLFGFGNANYPMFVGTRYEYDLTKIVDQGHPIKTIAGSTYMISRWLFILRAFLLQTLFIIAAAAFAFLLSTILKSSMVSTSVSIVIIIAFTIFQSLPYVKNISPYIFSTYGNAFTVMQGDLALRFQNIIFTTPFTIMILSVWSIICYLVSHIVFIKRDILI